MFREYQPLSAGPGEKTIQASTLQKLTPHQTDALKRVMVYQQNFQDATNEDPNDLLSSIKENLETEIIKALRSNLEISALYVYVNPTKHATVLDSALEKTETAELEQTKQTFYAEQIKQLSRKIRLSLPLEKGETVASVSQTIIDFVSKYQAAGGKVTDDILLNTFALPLGTYGQYKLSCKSLIKEDSKIPQIRLGC